MIIYRALFEVPAYQAKKKEIAYKTSCDLSNSDQVGYLWGVIRGTNLHTKFKELVYDKLWDIETSPIQFIPLAQDLPTQPASLVQATPPIQPALLAQPLLTKFVPLAAQPTSSIVKPALTLQTIRPCLPALPLVEPVSLASSAPVLCASATFQFILQTFEFDPLATIESDLPPVMGSITQEESMMQVLTV